MSGISFTLADDPRAKAIYDRLIEDGVKRSDIDTGYYDLSLIHQGGFPEIVGRGDGEIAPQEVYEYLLNNYGRYRQLLFNETRLFYPYHLPSAAKRTDELERAYVQIRSLVNYIFKELKRREIERGDDSFNALVYHALWIALVQEDKISSALLKNHDLAGMIPDLRRMGRSLAVVKGKCPHLSLLAKQIEDKCVSGKGREFNLLALALSYAGLRPHFAMRRTEDEGNDGHFISVMLRDRDGRVQVPADLKEMEWSEPSSRLSMFLSFMAMIDDNYYNIDPESSAWIGGLRLLVPESIAVRNLYGLWLMNREDPQPEEAYKEFEHIMKTAGPIPNIAVNMAAALLAMQKYPEVIETLTPFMDSEVSHQLDMGSVAYLMYHSYLGTNDEGMARSVLEKYLKFLPNNAAMHAEAARLRNKSGDMDGAIEAMERAYNLDRGNTEYRRRLLEYYYSAGRLDDLETALKKALNEDPGFDVGYVALARLLLEKGERNEPLIVLTRGLRALPGNEEIIHFVPAAFIHTQRPERGIELLNREIESGRGSALVYRSLGVIYLHLNNPQQSIKAFRRAHDMQPDEMANLLGLALNYTLKGTIEEAEKVFKAIDPDKLLKDDVGLYRIYYAVFLCRAGRLEKVREMLDDIDAVVAKEGGLLPVAARAYKAAGQLNRIRPMIRRLETRARSEPESYLLLAEIQHQIGDHKKEVLYLRRALKAMPGDEHVRMKLAYAHWMQSNYDAALTEADKIIASSSVMFYKAFASAIKGAVLRLKGRKEEGLEEFRRAAELNAPMHYVYRDIGTDLIAKNDLDAALEYLHRALAMNTDDDSTWNNIAVAYKRKGDVEKAEHYYNMALQAESKNDRSYIYRNLAILYLENKRFAEAIDIAAAGIDIAGKSASLYEIRALAYEMSGDIESAISDYKAAVTLNPNALDVLFSLYDLYSRQKSDADMKRTARDVDAVNKDCWLSNLIRARESARDNNTDDALKYAQRSLEMVPSGDKFIQSYIHSFIGYFYAMQLREHLSISKNYDRQKLTQVEELLYVKALQSFKRAIDLSEGKNLQAKKNYDALQSFYMDNIHLGPPPPNLPSPAVIDGEYDRDRARDAMYRKLSDLGILSPQRPILRRREDVVPLIEFMVPAVLPEPLKLRLKHELFE